jgi:hypothetical protein
MELKIKINLFGYGYGDSSVKFKVWSLRIWNKGLVTFII